MHCQVTISLLDLRARKSQHEPCFEILSVFKKKAKNLLAINSVWCLRYSKFNAAASENEMVKLYPVAVSLFRSELCICQSF